KAGRTLDVNRSARKKVRDIVIIRIQDEIVIGPAKASRLRDVAVSEGHIDGGQRDRETVSEMRLRDHLNTFPQASIAGRSRTATGISPAAPAGDVTEVSRVSVKIEKGARRGDER